MLIHKLYAKLSPIFRRRRMRLFLRIIQPSDSERILDIGGYSGFWRQYASSGSSVDIVNIDMQGELRPVPNADLHCHIRTGYGNACALNFPDQSYDVCFSNSVIEHVGTWENQKKFAAEESRVGKKL